MRVRNPDMLIVTTAVGPQRAGCLVGFHSQCSIEPDRYAVWLSKANHTCQLALRATHFGLHFLRHDHGTAWPRSSARCVAVRSTSSRSAPAHTGPFDVPIIDACSDWVVARRTAFLEEGSDHICFIVEPVEASAGEPSGPLRFEDVADLTPGHDAEERTARESP